MFLIQGKKNQPLRFLREHVPQCQQGRMFYTLTKLLLLCYWGISLVLLLVSSLSFDMALSSVHLDWNFNERSKSFFVAKHFESFFWGRKTDLHMSKALKMADSYLHNNSAVLCNKNLFCSLSSVFLPSISLWELLLQKSVILLYTLRQYHHIHSDPCSDFCYIRYDLKFP